MLTFQDITDTENVERALAPSAPRRSKPPDQMKVDFVHHVSYELRSPLTTIMASRISLTDRPPGADAETGRISRLHHARPAAVRPDQTNILDLATTMPVP